MGKYKSYILKTDTEEFFFNNYKEAFVKYNKSEDASLYGLTEFGEITLILSKGI